MLPILLEDDSSTSYVTDRDSQIGGSHYLLYVWRKLLNNLIVIEKHVGGSIALRSSSISFNKAQQPYRISYKRGGSRASLVWPIWRIVV